MKKNIQSISLITIAISTVLIFEINAMGPFLEDYYESVKMNRNQKQNSDQAMYARQSPNEENRQRAAALKIQRMVRKEKSLPEIQTQNVAIKGWLNFSYPTSDNIKQLMVEQYFPQLPRENIFVQEIPGGSHTEKIYQVAVDLNNEQPSRLTARPIFFLKISSLENSTQKLIDLQQGAVGRLRIEKIYQDTQKTLKVDNNDLPIITWLEKVFVDKDLAGNTSVIEVCHAAQGDSLLQIMFKDNFTYSQIAQNPDQLKQMISNQNIKTRQALVKSGQSLGLFQQAFMQYHDESNPATWQTVAHNDLHLSNIFFDEKKSQTYFIDNETMTENQSILNDITNLLASTTNVISQTVMASKKQSNSFWLNQKNAPEISLKYSIMILKGYIESFPENKRPSLAQLLQQQETYFAADSSSMPLYYSEEVRQEIIKFLERYKTA